MCRYTECPPSGAEADDHSIASPAVARTRRTRGSGGRHGRALSAVKSLRVRRAVRGIGILLLLGLAGCAAAYSTNMGSALQRMSRGDYEAALDRLDKPDSKTDLLLYRLERGLMLHYHGQYERSNEEFAQAEDLIDRLFTRSVSREMASLLSSDAIRAYRGEEFERVIIHYYRAMNFQHLGQPQAALVECRKANLKLAEFALSTDYELNYRNDAFMQYLTGMMYEAESEWNDAYVAYRAAERGYQAYSELFGLRAPRELGVDLAGVSARLGYERETQETMRRYGLTQEDLAAARQSRIIAFIETGFIGRKHQYEVRLPIMESDDVNSIWLVSNQMAYRYRHPHLYRRGSVRYWLRIALPEYRPVPSVVRSVRLHADDVSATGVVLQDLNAIAMETFTDKHDTIVARTAARALAKYMASRGVEKAFERAENRDDDRVWMEGLGRFMGALVNLFGVATEAADTRSWMSLPARVHMVRLQVPPGTVDLQVQFLNASGDTVETQRIPAVRVPNQAPVFVNFRGYR